MGGGATENYLTAAQRLQSRIARWITGHSKRTRIRKLLEDCDWLSIREMEKYHSMIQVWKLVRLGKPENMVDKMILTDESLIRTTIPRLLFTKSGFRWRAADCWNMMPMELRTNQSLPSFKKSVNKWIKQRRRPEPDKDYPRTWMDT